MSTRYSATWRGVTRFDISEMVGMTPASVKGAKGDDTMVFTMMDGRVVTFYHEQDCCESVDIEDVVGDLTDLVGLPLTQAAVETKKDENHSWGEGEWTYYTFATNRGTVTVRWYGESNGYYSTAVSYMIEDGDVTTH